MVETNRSEFGKNRVLMIVEKYAYNAYSYHSKTFPIDEEIIESNCLFFLII